jgi:hypothetical protein
MGAGSGASINTGFGRPYARGCVDQSLPLMHYL